MLIAATLSLECSLVASIVEVGKYYISVRLGVSQTCAISKQILSSSITVNNVTIMTGTV